MCCGVESGGWRRARLFFFKQKTAYEMRISDWSSDVCSSDLRERIDDLDVLDVARDDAGARVLDLRIVRALPGEANVLGGERIAVVKLDVQIGRASCRERVCQYV